MTVAYATIVKTETEFQILIVATHAKQYPVDHRIGPFKSKADAREHAMQFGISTTLPSKADAREHAMQFGISTTLPSKADVRNSVSHKPFHENFFSAKQCRLHRDPAPMKVIRLEDGYIGLNNGRSTWLWTGDDLRRIPD